MPLCTECLDALHEPMVSVPAKDAKRRYPHEEYHPEQSSLFGPASVSLFHMRHKAFSLLNVHAYYENRAELKVPELRVYPHL